MPYLIAILLLILVSGGAWILNYESRFVRLAPCSSELDGKFIVAKDCEPSVESQAKGRQ